MHLQPISLEAAGLETKAKRYKYGPIQWQINAFMASDADCAEITWEPGEYVSASAASASYARATKRLKVAARVVMRQGRVCIYKLKEDDTDDFV